MTTVTSTVLDTDDQPVPDVAVRIDLVGADGTGQVGAHEYMVSGSVTGYGAGGRPSRMFHITVPDGPGPYQAKDL